MFPVPLSTVPGGTSVMSLWNNDALLFLREKLKINVLMNTGLVDKLETAAGGFMSQNEAMTVRELPINIAQVDRVMEILHGKSDKDFMIFCKMLRDSNQVVWADELERVAELFKRGEGNILIGGAYTVLAMSCSHLLFIHSVLIIYVFNTYNVRVTCLC